MIIMFLLGWVCYKRHKSVKISKAEETATQIGNTKSMPARTGKHNSAVTTTAIATTGFHGEGQTLPATSEWNADITTLNVPGGQTRSYDTKKNINSNTDGIELTASNDEEFEDLYAPKNVAAGDVLEYDGRTALGIVMTQVANKRSQHTTVGGVTKGGEIKNGGPIATDSVNLYESDDSRDKQKQLQIQTTLGPAGNDGENSVQHDDGNQDVLELAMEGDGVVDDVALSNNNGNVPVSFSYIM